MQHVGAAITVFCRGVLLNPVLFYRVGTVNRTLADTEVIQHKIVQLRTVMTNKVLARPSKSKAVTNQTAIDDVTGTSFLVAKGQDVLEETARSN